MAFLVTATAVCTRRRLEIKRQFIHYAGLNHLPHRSCRLRYNCNYHIRSSIFTTTFLTTIEIRKYPTSIIRRTTTPPHRACIPHCTNVQSLHRTLNHHLLFDPCLFAPIQCAFLLPFTMRHPLDFLFRVALVHAGLKKPKCAPCFLAFLLNFR